MADHAAEGDGNDVFIYMGGDQVVPRDVTHAIVDRSVDTITRRAFYNCRRLVSIEMHDDVKIIEVGAFESCFSVKRIKLPGVRVIESSAFMDCRALEDVEFGNKLDKIGSSAFRRCTSIRRIKIPKARQIKAHAFANCYQLTEAELSEDLEDIGWAVFDMCRPLERIAIPLKNDMIGSLVFNGCDNLSQVDLVGGIHKTISSLFLWSWRNEMNSAISRINWYLPRSRFKSLEIQEWILRILRRIEHYKAEHYALLKEAISLLELTLWKANLLTTEGEEKQPAKRAKLDEECGGKTLTKAVDTVKEAKCDDDAARRAARVTCGADIIIKNVLPFLNDNDEFPLIHQEAS
jgi:hypothetical protein